MLKLIRILQKKNSNLHILTVVVAVVFVWRGLWGLLDLYFLPEFPSASYLFSLALGLLILVVIDNSKLDELE